MMKHIKPKVANYYSLDQKEQLAWSDLQSAVYERNVKMCIKYAMYLKWIQDKKTIS